MKNVYPNCCARCKHCKGKYCYAPKRLFIIRDECDQYEQKQTVVFDFDGVIHSYTSGWKGATEIPDPMVPGIMDAIKELRENGYEVVVVSTRCATVEGMTAVETWLSDHGIFVDGVKAEKPPAIVYIDDRAICFDGNTEKLLEKVKSFKPWYKE